MPHHAVLLKFILNSRFAYAIRCHRRCCGCCRCSSSVYVHGRRVHIRVHNLFNNYLLSKAWKRQWALIQRSPNRAHHKNYLLKSFCVFRWPAHKRVSLSPLLHRTHSFRSLFLSLVSFALEKWNFKNCIVCGESVAGVVVVVLFISWMVRRWLVRIWSVCVCVWVRGAFVFVVSLSTRDLFVFILVGNLALACALRSPPSAVASFVLMKIRTVAYKLAASFFLGLSAVIYPKKT